MTTKFIEEINGTFKFESEKDGEKQIFIVGATSKSEALQRVEAIVNAVPDKVAIIKTELTSKVKQIAKEQLTATDYKVTRHLEQLELKAETSLTELEYKTLLEERNYYRTKSNQIESQIEALTTLQDLENFEIKY